VSAITKVEEDRPDGTVRVWGTGKVVGKGSKERTFYFDESTVGLIDVYLRTRNDRVPALFISERKQRLSRRAIQDVLSTWCARLGLHGVHIHQLRHFYASRLADAGIDAHALRNLIGHENYDTTLRYITTPESTNAAEYFAAMERATTT
jgi:site-specific recombinase XerD